MSSCAACGSTGQPDGAKFCFTCGNPLTSPGCVSCGAELMAGARFCSSCGAVQTVVPPAEPAPTPVSARRVATVLFGDLVGFTTLSESRDTEEVRELLSRYFEESRQIVERYGGLVEKFIGDAVMAVWGVPATHEDDAERAVRAGLELVTRISAMGADLGVPELAMRVGLVTGEVAVTIGATQQGMVAGDVVNTASRVQSAATPGQVWVDETTRLLTSGSVTYVDVGSHTLKGKADPLPLWSARAVVAGVGGGQRADGLEAPLVGRDRELRLVKELFHGVDDTGRPALLVIGGEPGVGKSRLGWELFKYIDGLSRPVRWHNGRCLAYGEGVAFFALAEALRARLQVAAQDLQLQSGEDPDAEADPGELLAAGLRRYVPDPEEQRWLEPRLAALLGTGSTGGFQRDDLFAAWVTFLERVGEGEHPVVLLIDDAHHADEGLLAFLEHLLAVAGFGCLVVLLARPGLLLEHPQLASNRRATILHLEPLDESDMATMVDGLVGGLPEDVRATLVDRAEGIPLYAVETIRSLIDRDLVVPRGGQYVLADPGSLDLEAVGAPASLHTLIAARLDTLTPEQRRVIDQGSVLGVSFARDSIARLCPDVTDLEGVLAALVRQQVLQQEGSRFSTERGEYQFVQSAVRQVAYGSLARRDRKAAHLAVVAVLAEHDAATEIAAVIAQHYLDAIDAVPGDPDVAELNRAAVEHLRLAAERAAALGSPGEAVGHLGEALERCTDERGRAELQLALANELDHAGRYDEAIARAQEAIDVFQAAGEDLKVAAAVAVQGACLVAKTEYARAEELVRPTFESLRGRSDAALTFLAVGRVLVSADLSRGRPLGALLDELIPVAEQIGAVGASVDFYSSLSVHFQVLGATQLGLVINRAAGELARMARETTSLGRILINLASAVLPDDATEAVTLGREGLAVTRSSGRSYHISGAAVNLSMALWLAGEWDELAAVLEEPMEHDDLLAAAFVSALADFERGRPVVALDPGPGDVTNTQLDAWRRLIVAWCAHHVDEDPTAGRQALAAVRDMYAIAGLYDDFTLMWGVAADLLAGAHDGDVLQELCDLVDSVPESALSTGLRGHRAMVAAVTAERTDPDAAGAHYRRAVQHYGSWHTPLFEARARAGLAAWLRARGQDETAATEEAAARTIFDSLGASRGAAQWMPVR